MRLRLALLLCGLTVGVGCAQIEGRTDEVIGAAGSGKDRDKKDAGAEDAGVQPDAALGVDAAAEPVVDAGVDAAAEPTPQPDGGDPDVIADVDASMPPPMPPNGTCAAPFELTFSSNRATATGTTSGAGEGVNPKCLPSGGVVGPEHVYHFRMPFKGRVAVVTTATAPFVASAYVRTACGDAATEKACGYGGSLTYDANAGEEVYLYIDSGSRNATTPNAGAYSVRVTLREEVAAGGVCGSGDADPYCAAGSLCQDEGAGGVCRAGNPETCATAHPLSFHSAGGSRVARVTHSTTGAKDDVSPTCSQGFIALDGVDHVYSFTISASTAVNISLKSSAGYDAALVILQTTCSASPSTPNCFDDEFAAGDERVSGTLAAGTYFIVVDAASATVQGSGAYDLTVTLTP